jgi:hypothetical protein
MPTKSKSTAKSMKRPLPAKVSDIKKPLPGKVSDLKKKPPAGKK